ncbi:MAG TPA: 4Fe-4S dicluster domain-containing protein [Candidatus Saccharimonadales bacterium]|nr:4Fe-4S dicluster domain-containing protein [Candidatus Saccharimonadales bacterium]
MTYVVSRLCRDCKDTGCVSVCPVDCFYVPKAPSEELPDQLYISADECIDCGACEPECPWEAITEGEAVPEPFADDTPLNALCDSRRDEFDLAVHEEKERPSPEEVVRNKAKWGLEA